MIMSASKLPGQKLLFPEDYIAISFTDYVYHVFKEYAHQLHATGEQRIYIHSNELSRFYTQKNNPMVFHIMAQELSIYLFFIYYF